MRLRRPAAIAAAIAASVLLVGGVSACGSDDAATDTATTATATTATATTATTAASTDTTAATTDTTAATTSTTEKVGGTATCDEASLVKAAKAADPNVTGLDTPDAFQCSDGWAYASVDTGGPDGYAEVMVFEAEGQFWISKDRAVVCKSPGDQVPASLYQAACETS